jgi:hypothetical protein
MEVSVEETEAKTQLWEHKVMSLWGKNQIELPRGAIPLNVETINDDEDLLHYLVPVNEKET